MVDGFRKKNFRAINNSHERVKSFGLCFMGVQKADIPVEVPIGNGSRIEIRAERYGVFILCDRPAGMTERKIIYQIYIKYETAQRALCLPAMW